MIKKIVQGDILGDLREGDHVIFSLSTDGQHKEGLGYGVVERIIQEFCPSYADLGPITIDDIGKVITHKSDEGVLFHGILNHTVTYGWDYEYERYSSYDAIYNALQALYDEYDDYLGARSMRSLWLGRGKMRRYGNQGNINWNLQAMANSKADLAVFVLDGYDE